MLFGIKNNGCLLPGEQGIKKMLAVRAKPKSSVMFTLSQIIKRCLLYLDLILIHKIHT